MHDHLIAVSKLQSQLGFSMTAREGTAVIIIAICAVVIGIVRKLIF